MADTNFPPIFDYLDEQIAPRFEKLEQDNRDIKTAISNLSSQVKKYHEEMLVFGHRIDRDRLEEWAKSMGEKVGLPISF